MSEEDPENFIDVLETASEEMSSDLPESKMSDLKKEKSVSGKKRKSFQKKGDTNKVTKMAKKKGLAEGTTRKRDSNEIHFNTYCKTFDLEIKNLDDFCKEGNPKEMLEDAVCEYFEAYTVGEKEELPSRNYADSIRSHLRMLIKEKTKGRWDLNDEFQMPKFHVSFFHTS